MKNNNSRLHRNPHWARRTLGVVSFILISGLFAWGLTFPTSKPYSGPFATFWNIVDIASYIWLALTLLSKVNMIMDKKNVLAKFAGSLWGILMITSFFVAIVDTTTATVGRTTLQSLAGFCYFFILPWIDVAESL